MPAEQAAGPVELVDNLNPGLRREACEDAPGADRCKPVIFRTLLSLWSVSRPARMAKRARAAAKRRQRRFGWGEGTVIGSA